MYPAIISGGIAERAKFGTQVIAGAILVGLIYPFFESLMWGQYSGGLNDWLMSAFGARFHDYAGSVVVHAMGGWLALPAIMILGPRLGRYHANGKVIRRRFIRFPMSHWAPGFLWWGGLVLMWPARASERYLRAGSDQLADGDGGGRGGRLYRLPQRFRGDV